MYVHLRRRPSRAAATLNRGGSYRTESARRGRGLSNLTAFLFSSVYSCTPSFCQQISSCIRASCSHIQQRLGWLFPNENRKMCCCLYSSMCIDSTSPTSSSWNIFLEDSARSTLYSYTYMASRKKQTKSKRSPAHNTTRAVRHNACGAAEQHAQHGWRYMYLGSFHIFQDHCRIDSQTPNPRASGYLI